MNKKIILTIILKLLGVGLTYLLLPLLLKNIGMERYGIWVLLISIFTWVNNFDFGIGSSLKNKVSEILLEKDYNKLSIYIISSLFYFTVFIGVVLILFNEILKNISIDKLITYNTITKYEIISTLKIFLILLIVNSVYVIFIQIVYAFEEGWIDGVGSAVPQLALVLYFLIYKGKGIKNLFDLTSIYTLIFSVVYILLVIVFYLRHKNKLKFHYPKFEVFKTIVLSGKGFFIQQITSLFVFTIDNLLIAKYLGAEDISVYNIYGKIFGIIIFLHTIVINLIWPIVRKKYIENNYLEMKLIIKKVFYFSAVLYILNIIIYIFAERIIKIWTNNDIRVSGNFKLMYLFYVVIFIWNNNFGMILNAIGKLRRLNIIAIISAFINIPIILYLLIDIKLGLEGVLLGINIVMLMSAIVSPMIVNKYIKMRGKIEKKIIFTNDHIGDVVIRFEVLKKYIEYFGKENVYFVIDKNSIEIFEMLTNNLVIFENKGIRKILSLIKILFLTLFNSDTMIVLINKGYKYHKYFSNFIFKKKFFVDDNGGVEYVLKSQLNLLNKITNKSYTLNDIKPNLTHYFNQLKSDKKYIVIGMGVSFAFERVYPPEKFAKVIDYILKFDYDIIFLGNGIREKNYYNILIDNLNLEKNYSDKIKNYIGKTDLFKCIELINGSSIFVGVEGGLWNVSYSLKKKSVVIYGGGHFGRFKHDDSNIKYIYRQMDCYECLWKCKYLSNENETFKCINDITSDEIIKKVYETIIEVERENIL